MYSLKKVFVSIVPLLLLCSCAQVPVSVSQATSEAVSPSPEVSHSITPSSSITPLSSVSASAVVTQTPEPSGTISPAGSISPDVEGYSLLPGSLPELTAADINKFNHNKVFSYLAADGCITYLDYWYSITKSELKDGVLYLTLSLNISLADVNTACQDLKQKRSLTDRQILSVPQFKDCVIKDGVMYADEDTWHDRQSYSSYEAWQKDNDGYINLLDQWTTKLAEHVPVSGDASITLFDYANNGKYTNLTMEQFEQYLSDPDTLDAAEGTGFLLDMVYFKYSDGKITSIYQDSGNE